MVHWSADGWRTARDDATVDSGLGVHHADLPTSEVGPGSSVSFTFYWPGASRWEGVDVSVAVVATEEEEEERAEPTSPALGAVAAAVLQRPRRRKPMCPG